MCSHVPNVNDSKKTPRLSLHTSTSIFNVFSGQRRGRSQPDVLVTLKIKQSVYMVFGQEIMSPARMSLACTFEDLSILQRVLDVVR